MNDAAHMIRAMASTIAVNNAENADEHNVIELLARAQFSADEIVKHWETAREAARLNVGGVAR